MPNVEKPRIRNASGQYSARGALTAKLLRAAYGRPVAFASTQPVVHFDACSSKPQNVDKQNAIIRGVSVITSGVTARGHDLEVDDITLEQMQNCAAEKGQVPVKVDHKSGAAAICGFLTNFRREANKLLADWHLLQSHPQKDQILEVAERMPRGVGLSAAFVAPEKPERTAKGAKAARCSELISVDYVTLPAANPDGMFEAKVDSHQNAMNPEILAAIEAAIAKAVAPIATQLAEQGKQLSLISNPPSLEEVAQMDEKQLAELGLTPQDVQEALAELAGEQDGQVDAQTDATVAQTDAAPVGAGASAATATTAALSALTKQVTELSRKLAEKDAKAEADQVEVLFADTEAKIEALALENAQLREANKNVGKPVSAGVAGVRFFSAKANEGKFEQLVQFGIEQDKLPRSKAFSAAMKKDPEAYKDYLVRLGVVKAE